MSTAAANSSSSSSSSATTTTNNDSSNNSSSSSFFTALGFPLTIAIAIGLLVLLAALLLFSYFCRRAPSRPPSPPSPPRNPDAALSRIVFVAEDNDDEDGPESGSGRRRSAVPAGLDQAAISSYPKFPFAAAKDGEDLLCSICLCEYREGEMLRMIPDCRHCFHLLCVDVWLRLNASCPVCRTSPLPTPVSTPISTPLSELAPLSRYAADRRRT